MEELRPITGVFVNYYFVCKRKLWLFAHDIKMEQTSDTVALGKLIDETTYAREKKHILIDNLINIDFFGIKGYINEVKKSNTMEEADIWQVRYYLYYLKKKGLLNMKGILDYPKLRKKEIVELTPTDEEKLEKILSELKEIIKQEKPPSSIKTKVCRKCSYFELCFI